MADNEQKARDLIAEAEKKLVAKPFLGKQGPKVLKTSSYLKQGRNDI